MVPPGRSINTKVLPSGERAK